LTPIQALIIVGLVVFLFGFYALGIYLNKRTPIPEGCEIPSMGCESCSQESCGMRTADLKAEIKAELMKSKSEEGGLNG
jgi:hypothetical protein